MTAGWDAMLPFIQRVIHGESITKVALESSVDRNTLYKYIKKYCIHNNIPYPTRRLDVPPTIKPPDGESEKVLPPSQIPHKEYLPAVKSSATGKRIAVIPDMQVKPDIDLSYAAYIGHYMAHKKPDIIINGGDFADMLLLERLRCSWLEERDGGQALR